MIRHFTALCLIYVTLILQSTVMEDLFTVGVRPWLPGIAAVVCGLLSSGSPGLILAALLGLGIDCQTDRLGVNLALAVIVTSGVMMQSSDKRSAGVIAITLLVLVTTFTWRVAAALAFAVLDEPAVELSATIVNRLYDAAATAALAMMIALFLRGLLNEWGGRTGSSLSLGNRWSMLTSK